MPTIKVGDVLTTTASDVVGPLHIFFADPFDNLKLKVDGSEANVLTRDPAGVVANYDSDEYIKLNNPSDFGVGKPFKMNIQLKSWPPQNVDVVGQETSGSPGTVGIIGGHAWTLHGGSPLHQHSNGFWRVAKYESTSATGIGPPVTFVGVVQSGRMDASGFTFVGLNLNFTDETTTTGTGLPFAFVNILYFLQVSTDGVTWPSV